MFFMLSSKISLRLQFSGCKIAVKVKFVYAMKAYIYIYIYIQGVPGGKDLTSGECSLGQTITI